MSATTRVLILNERDPRHPRAGGAEVHLTELAPRLAERGFEITQLACSFAGAREEEVVDSMRVRRLGSLATYYPRVAWTCARETRRGCFDVVMEVLCKLPFFSPLYSAAPVLAVCHHLFGRAAYRQLPWPAATCVIAAENAIPTFYRKPPFIAVSPSTRDDLIERGIGAERIRVIFSGSVKSGGTVSENGTPRSGAPSISPPPADLENPTPRTVTFLGRLEPYKQIDTLLRAMALLSDRFPDVGILVIGRGVERQRLEGVASELGLRERTRFTGFVSAAQRDALLARSSVCVCPSEKEGWGLTVIEANALGVPVVATDAPGLRDSVRDGETGFLVPDGDIAAFADRIGRLLSDDALSARMSEAATAWARHFDWDRAADSFADAMQVLRRTS